MGNFKKIKINSNNQAPLSVRPDYEQLVKVLFGQTHYPVFYSIPLSDQNVLLDDKFDSLSVGRITGSECVSKISTLFLKVPSLKLKLQN